MHLPVLANFNEPAEVNIFKEKDMIDISQCLNEEGHLVWNALEGDWTIVRMGVKMTGASSRPSPDQRVNYDNPNNELKNQTDQIIRLAKENQVGLVDSYNAFEFLYANKRKLKKYMSQVNHPSEKGHELIANEIMNYFKK
jgi:hypothetical protein